MRFEFQQPQHGLSDLYPFVIPPVVIKKLRSIHQVIKVAPSNQLIGQPHRAGQEWVKGIVLTRNLYLERRSEVWGEKRRNT